VHGGVPVGWEIKRSGDEARVVCDGSGVEALAGIAHPEDKRHSLLMELGNSVDGACGHCAIAHKVKDQIVGASYALLADDDGEVSVRNYVTEGCTVLNF